MNIKSLLFGSMLLLPTVACKKQGGLCDTGCYEIPARFYFLIADKQGNSLITSTTDGIGVAYQQNNQLVTLTALNYPQKTVVATATASNPDFIVADGTMAEKSVAGIQTFYLTFKGKIDTLGLDIHKIPATPDNGGNSIPVVTFNGRPMQSMPGAAINTLDYFVLKRR